MKKLLLVSSMAAALAAPMFAHAESKTNTAVIQGGTASAKLDFEIKIPAILYIRIGTGSLRVGDADITTVDKILFDVPVLNFGDSANPTPGTGGDLGAGAVTARVFSNFGSNVTLNASAPGQLTTSVASGSNTIPWTEIGIASAALATTTAGYSATALSHPTLNATGSGGTGVNLAVDANKLVRQEAKWTFTYKNTTTPVAGTYGTGVGSGQNGRLTYTVTQL